jgi:hypothetical protein
MCGAQGWFGQMMKLGRLRHRYEIVDAQCERLKNVHYSLRERDLTIDILRRYGIVYIKSSQPLRQETIEAICIWTRLQYADMNPKEFLKHMFGSLQQVVQHETPKAEA